jgi:dolichyl-phosphate-mannose--protein O-mannosyl transferase
LTIRNYNDITKITFSSKNNTTSNCQYYALLQKQHLNCQLKIFNSMNLLNRDGFLNPLHGNSNRGGFLNVVASTLTLKHASGGGSGDLQITQQYLSSGHQSCSIYLNNNGVLGQQQPQLTRFAFPVNNPASVIEPFSNLQNNDQLQMVSNIGAASYPTSQGLLFRCEFSN